MTYHCIDIILQVIITSNIDLYFIINYYSNLNVYLYNITTNANK